jgi:two-component system, chemotaxis family, response regulator Rcp1
MNLSPPRSLKVLLVEDSPSDANLIMTHVQRAHSTSQFFWVEDGESAIDYLHQQEEYSQSSRPDLILLDLNLPQMSGHDVLEHIKADSTLKQIPVLILTTSDYPADISRAYNLHVNCYLTKPADAQQFKNLTQAIGDFWFHAVQLPS